ncbi:MAG: AAA family ATPase [Minicystis sp.]
MITRVRIRNFRGVREGTVDGLSPISILVGPNNSGKSTTLEAIALVGKEPDPDEIVKLLRRRGGPLLDAFEHVAHHEGAEVSLEIQQRNGDFATDCFLSLSTSRVVAEKTDNDGKPMKGPKVRLVFRGEKPAGPIAQAPPFTLEPSPRGTPVPRLGAPHPEREIFVNDDDQLAYGKAPATTEPFPSHLVDLETVREHEALEDAHASIGKAGRLDLVVSSLQRAMAGLTNLVIFKSGAKFVLHTVRGTERPVPAYLAGDGFKRFLALAAAALGTPQGVVLLEEPETYQHPRYLEELAAMLHIAAAEGTQIILSTHSIELIDALLRAPAAEGKTYPTVHRMRLFEGNLGATTLDRDLALRVRDDLLQDLRA